MKKSKQKNGNRTFGTPAHNKEIAAARKERELKKSRAKRMELKLGRRTRYKIIKKKEGWVV